jgi:sugar phosphate permease
MSIVVLPPRETSKGDISTTISAPNATTKWPVSPGKAMLFLGCVVLGYIGIYLCRKNLSVAQPLIQKEFGLTKAQIGLIASCGTVTYAIGKIVFGPIIDKFGGRICFLCALGAVCLFGGLEAFAVSGPMLGFLFSTNRLFGSAGWGAMAKQVPDWFPQRHMAMAMAVLSLSFVFGGVLALLLAGQIAAISGDQWRAVIGFPALILLGILLICWFVLPRGTAASVEPGGREEKRGFRFAQIVELTRIPQFWIVCGLSFVLTITRETFNVWTVDFIKTEGGGSVSSQVAALLSTPFDAAGAVGILFLGYILDRLAWPARRALLFSILGLLAILIYLLPNLFHAGMTQVTIVLALIGFLSYGPYSLLAGIFAVEIRGKAFVGTVAGLVDASGYFGGIVSGYYFGKLLDTGGYRLGFHFLGVVTVAAAVLCLFLGRSNKHNIES